MSTDPLLRATADGDTACPDGRALAALGRSVRDASALPRPVDLIAGVMSRLDANEHEAADCDLDDDTIDAFYDGDGRGPAELVNLSLLIRTTAQIPHAVDLADRVRGHLHGSLRLSAKRALDLGSRWRVWSAVVAGHVAALLALAVYQFHTSQPAPEPEQSTSTTASTGDAGVRGPVGSQGNTPSVAPAASSSIRPASWAQIPGTTLDLFAPRRSELSRATARSAAAMADTAATVAGGLRWIAANQDPTSGRFGTLAEGDRAIAVHSLALLTILGEGLDHPQRAQSAKLALAWLADHQKKQPILDTTAAGLSLLAQVEGALLTNDPLVRGNAEAALIAAESIIPARSGPAGLGGFLLLAYETAHQGGLAVPQRALIIARQNLGLPLPNIESDDAGRLGLAAFARFISGRADNARTPELLAELGRLHRLPRADLGNRIDPFGWYFASLAAHQSGGPLWNQWSDALRRTIIRDMISEGDTCHLPATSVRFAESMADGDLFATSAAVLELQISYRYLPVAR